MRITQLLVAAMRGSLSARIAPSRGIELPVFGLFDLRTMPLRMEAIGTTIVIDLQDLLKILSS